MLERIFARNIIGVCRLLKWRRLLDGLRVADRLLSICREVTKKEKNFHLGVFLVDNIRMK